MASEAGTTGVSPHVQDPFAFDIQLNTEDEQRNFHRKNYPGQIQRPDIVDECCLGLLLKARLDRVVHGWEAEGGQPATLIVFGFRFHGASDHRRFKRATIKITFRDEQKREDKDPAVTALWPDGEYTLGQPTQVAAEDMHGAELSLGLTSGTPIQPTAQATLRWEKKRAYTKETRASLKGSTYLDYTVRDYGEDNAVCLNLQENPTTESGIVTDFRAAVLVRRHNPHDKFSATVKVEAKAHFLHKAIKGLRSLSGFSRVHDPVTFEPGIQYLRAATFMNGELARDIDEKNLTKARLDELGSVLGTTVLML